MRNTKKALFVYVSESNTGISAKAEKIEYGFKEAGYDVTALYFHNNPNKILRLASWIKLQIAYFKLIISQRFDVIYIRYAYYFFLIYIISFIFGKKYQVEINSNISGELKFRNQMIRLKIDRLVENIVAFSCYRIHVVSKQLLSDIKSRHPSASAIFNPNFVIDETPPRNQQSLENRKVRLVFLGNANQPWHGIEKFISQAVIGNDWFLQHCELHIIGATCSHIEDLVKTNFLESTVKFHGFLSGADKTNTMANMDIGIGGFNLESIGLTETTGIKNGEYLHLGMPVILGYEDPAIPSTLSFVLKINADQRQESVKKIKTFIETFIQTPLLKKFAHEYARDNLLVSKYIEKIIHK